MKASSNVPKTYVVKVAGQPDEGKLDKLRGGGSIAEKGGRRVRTAPARIRLIQEADNPWLEVTIIEGRNRQVRKMFEEVGHHVEKIRRVKYGPLSLDVPPGEFRSLTLEEVSRLKAAASGKPTYVPPPMELPTERTVKPSAPIVDRRAEGLSRPETAPHAKPPGSFKPRRDFKSRPAAARGDSRPPRDFKPRRAFGASPAEHGSRDSRPRREFRSPSERPQGLRPSKSFADRSTAAPRHPKSRPYSKPSRDFKPRREFRSPTAPNRDSKPRRDFRSPPAAGAGPDSKPQRTFGPVSKRPQGLKPSKSFADRSAEALRHPKARPSSKPRRDLRSPTVPSGDSKPRRDFRSPAAAGSRDAKPKRDFKPRRDSKPARSFQGRPNKSRFSPKG